MWNGWVTVNDELERMYKEAGMAYQQFPGGSEKKHKNLSQERQHPGQDLKLGHSKYKVGVLITQPYCLVFGITTPSLNMYLYMNYMQQKTSL